MWRAGVPVASVRRSVSTYTPALAARSGAADHPRGRLKYSYKPTWRPEAQHRVPTQRPSLEHDGDSIFSHEHFGARVLYLNRSSTLNTLNSSLIRKVHRQLVEWESNDAVEVVVIKSNLDDYFSRGGDVRFLVDKAKDPAKRAEALAYFREEYQLSHLIATYTKPLAVEMNGQVLSTGVAMMAQHRLSQEKSSFRLPNVKRGSVPGEGASFVLSRMPHGLGMYLGLTGDSLDGEELYWAGLSTIHTSDDMSNKYLEYVLGRATSTNRSNFDVDRDPVFQRNMRILKDNRGGMRYAYLLEEGSATREDMRNFTRLKGWYQNYRRGRYRIAEDWAQGKQQEEETGSVGELFHFNTPPELNDYSEPLEPDHHFLRDRVDHALATVFDGVVGDMPSDIAQRFRNIAECFAGDPDRGDSLLVMAADPDAAQPSRDEQRATLKDKLLPTQYEENLRPHLRGIVTNAIIRNGGVPEVAQVATLQPVVKSLMEQTWPYANPSAEAIGQACLEAGVDDSPLVVDAVLDAVVAVTSQLTGVPRSALYPEQPASKEDNMHELLASAADESRAETGDFLRIQDELHRAHVSLASKEDLLPESWLDADAVSESDRAELQALIAKAQGQRASGDTAASAPLAPEEVAALYAHVGLEPPSADTDGGDDLPGDEAAQVLSRTFEDSSTLSDEYVDEVVSDPAALQQALGLPDTPLARKAAKHVVRSLASERQSKYAVPQVASVDELYSRLNAKNTEWSREALAAMMAASPTAVRATHRLIVEGSTKSLAECLRMEYRVNARMLDTVDFVEGVEAALEGREPAWSQESLDLDALFAPTSDGGVGELPDLQSRLHLFDAQRDDEARWEAELQRWYESGEVQGAGSRELRSRFLWL